MNFPSSHLHVQDFTGEISQLAMFNYPITMEKAAGNSDLDEPEKPTRSSSMKTGSLMSTMDNGLLGASMEWL